MKNIFKIIAILFVSNSAFSQSNFKLHFTPKVSGLYFNLGENVTIAGEKVEIDYLNYYISNLHIIHNGGQDLDLSDTVFLVKHQNSILDLGFLDISNVEKITFGVGVPPAFNHLDISLYDLANPLSFQEPSMHWGWSSGYSHMIIGGNADSNADENPDAYFEIHSLGDGNFYNVEVVCNEINGFENQKDIFIDCNLDTWLGLTDLAANGIKHGENGVNLIVMKNVSLRPVFSFPLNASLHENSEFIGEFYSFIEFNQTKLTWKEMIGVDFLSIYDANGKLIASEKINKISGIYEINKLNSGIYFANLYSKEGKILNQIKIVN